MTEDSLGKMLILTSTERMNQVLDLLKRFPQLTYEDVIDLITVGVWEREQQKKLFADVMIARDAGIPSPALVPNLEFHLREQISASFHVADKIGGVSGIGSMVFVRENGRNPWEVYNPELLTRNFHEGQFGRISGLPRMGKTNTACRIMEQWAIRSDQIAISNILQTKEDRRYRYARDSHALFEEISRLEAGQRFVFVMDEGGLVYAKIDASTRRAKTLDRLVRIIGKLHGSMILVEQRVESVPTILQEFSTCLFFAERPGIVHIDLRGPALHFKTIVRGFPKTTLPFDTYDIAYFPVDEDETNGLFEAVSGATDVRGAMKRYLDRTSP